MVSRRSDAPSQSGCGLLQADNVTYEYGAHVSGRTQGSPLRVDGGDRAGTDQSSARAGVHGVSLSVAEGDLVGIIGPNGSGKTTLLRLLAGLLRPSSGRVMLGGRDLHSFSRRELARRVAVVPQETRLAFDFTVQEIVLMGRFPHLGPFEMEGRDDVAIAREALRSTGTLDLADRPFATLSGGEKQRVIIAGALAQAAAVMLLDEPTAALDPGYQLEITALLRRLNAERRVTMVVATHDLNRAAALCTDLVLMRAGRVLGGGPTRDALTRENIRRLYDVEADVAFSERAGHVTVVPIRRV
ncbi:MAG: ABC transporter ATP-binding protein [Acidobacteria bacterium]|nr:MAG: ABC transporter ATP-binding protein [Acidobacteriota bacterium]